MEPDARLDSGMRVTEAIAKAEKWWNEYRGAVAGHFNVHQDAPRVRAAANGAPGIVIKGEIVETVPSGILSGRPWRDLTLEERREIVKIWHHNHVVVPQVEGAQLKDMARVGQGKLNGSALSDTPHAGKPESKPSGGR